MVCRHYLRREDENLAEQPSALVSTLNFYGLSPELQFQQEPATHQVALQQQRDSVTLSPDGPVTFVS